MILWTNDVSPRLIFNQLRFDRKQSLFVHISSLMLMMMMTKKVLEEAKAEEEKNCSTIYFDFCFFSVSGIAFLCANLKSVISVGKSHKKCCTRDYGEMCVSVDNGQSFKLDGIVQIAIQRNITHI